MMEMKKESGPAWASNRRAEIIPSLQLHHRATQFSTIVLESFLDLFHARSDGAHFAIERPLAWLKDKTVI